MSGHQRRLRAAPVSPSVEPAESNPKVPAQQNKLTPHRMHQPLLPPPELWQGVGLRHHPVLPVLSLALNLGEEGEEGDCSGLSLAKALGCLGAASLPRR